MKPIDLVKWACIGRIRRKKAEIEEKGEQGTMQGDTIKGGYIGTVMIDFHVPIDSKELQPPAELSRTINERMSGMLRDLIKDELGDAADVTVARQESWVIDPREGTGDAASAKNEGGGMEDGIHRTRQ